MAIRLALALLLLAAAAFLAIAVHEDVRLFAYDLAMTAPSSGQGSSQCGGVDMSIDFRIIIGGDAPLTAKSLQVRLPQASTRQVTERVMADSRTRVTVQAKAVPAVAGKCGVWSDWADVHSFYGGDPSPTQAKPYVLDLKARNPGDPPDASISIEVGVGAVPLSAAPDSRNTETQLARLARMLGSFREVLAALLALVGLLVLVRTRTRARRS